MCCNTCHTLYCVFHALIGRFFRTYTPYRFLSVTDSFPLLFLLHDLYFFVHLWVFAAILVSHYYNFFFLCFVQAVETSLATTHCVGNFCSGQGTAAPHSGQEASIVQAKIPVPYPPTTNQPVARRINQNSAENLAQVEKILQKYELESPLFKVTPQYCIAHTYWAQFLRH